MEDELDMETQLEREFAAEQEELLEVEEEDEEDEDDENATKKKEKEAFEEKLHRERQQHQQMGLQEEPEPEDDDEFTGARSGLSKVRSLPSNFTYNPPAEKEKTTDGTIHLISASIYDYLNFLFLSIFFFLF